MTPRLSQRVVAWQRAHGRHGLPWQGTRDPYRIWLSEVMLQQTQVATVIPYYGRFLARFADVAALARAPLEQVLECWSGLGYYSRARNLHACAQQVVSRHGGVFPARAELLQELPGIGRSTAAAIAVFSHGERVAILDGNVKRVLCRCFGVDGFPGDPVVERGLWQIASAELPTDDTLVPYTQGLMDLGATLCTRSKPKCDTCPLQASCAAFQKQRVHELPTPKPRKAIPEKHTTMLILLDGDEVMLEKRPPTGIWGGLWSFPEAENTTYPDLALTRFGVTTHAGPPLAQLSHAFTHFKLHIEPRTFYVMQRKSSVAELGQIWLNIDDAIVAAIPTPVRKILQSLQKKLASI